MRRVDELRVTRHWAPPSAEEPEGIADLVGGMLARFVQGCRTAVKPANVRAHGRRAGETR